MCKTLITAKVTLAADALWDMRKGSTGRCRYTDWGLGIGDETYNQPSALSLTSKMTIKPSLAVKLCQYRKGRSPFTSRRTRELQNKMKNIY